MDSIQVMANCPTWAEQVDQNPSLSYMTVKEGENNSTNPTLIVEPTHGIEPTAILYTVNQSVDPPLWDGNFYSISISIFGMNEYLEGDAKNITCSLLRIIEL